MRICSSKLTNDMLPSLHCWKFSNDCRVLVGGFATIRGDPRSYWGVSAWADLDYSEHVATAATVSTSEVSSSRIALSLLQKKKKLAANDCLKLEDCESVTTSYQWLSAASEGRVKLLYQGRRSSCCYCYSCNSAVTLTFWSGILCLNYWDASRSD